MQACKEFSARVHGIIGLEESRWEEQATGCLISRFKTGEQLFRAGGKIQGSFAGTSPTACSRTTWAGTGASSRSSRRSPCTLEVIPLVALLYLLTELPSVCTCMPAGSGSLITTWYAGCPTATSYGCTPSYLVPALVASLIEQDKYDNENYWNPCKAPGVCLRLLATCCEDDIFAPCTAFRQG